MIKKRSTKDGDRNKHTQVGPLRSDGCEASALEQAGRDLRGQQQVLLHRRVQVGDMAVYDDQEGHCLHLICFLLCVFCLHSIRQSISCHSCCHCHNRSFPDPWLLKQLTPEDVPEGDFKEDDE